MDQADAFIAVVHSYDTEHGAKDLVLEQAHAALHVIGERRADEEASFVLGIPDTASIPAKRGACLDCAVDVLAHPGGYAIWIDWR